MRCERCGAELSAGGYCAACGADGAREPRVQVLSPAERNAYTGITIDEGNPERDAEIRFARKKSRWGGFSYTANTGSWQGALTLILGVSALLLFVFFIAIPVALALLAIGGASWLLYRLLRQL